ncbi:unnamed protein product [Withania somnifera]
MAEIDGSKIPALLERKKRNQSQWKSVEETEGKTSSTAPSEEDTSKTEQTPAVESSEIVPVPPEESSRVSLSTATEINEASPPVEAASEESTKSTEDDSGNENQESTDETPEIKLETAPADFRFPTTNQTRHCFTRYMNIIAAKGEGAPGCDKFAKYYRSLCPGECIDKWNEQRENGTFPGPL